MIDFMNQIDQTEIYESNVNISESIQPRVEIHAMNYTSHLETENDNDNDKTTYLLLDLFDGEIIC